MGAPSPFHTDEELLSLATAYSEAQRNAAKDAWTRIPENMQDASPATRAAVLDRMIISRENNAATVRKAILDLERRLERLELENALLRRSMDDALNGGQEVRGVQLERLLRRFEGQAQSIKTSFARLHEDLEKQHGVLARARSRQSLLNDLQRVVEAEVVKAARDALQDCAGQLGPNVAKGAQRGAA